MNLDFDVMDALIKYGLSPNGMAAREPTTMRALAKETVASLTRNPMFWWHTSGSLRSPEHVISERLHWACLLLREDIPFKVLNGTDSFDYRVSVATQALLSSPYLWKWEMREAALTTPLPRHVVDREVLDTPLMWWTFPDRLTISEITTHDGHKIVPPPAACSDAAVIAHQGNWFNVTTLGMWDEGLPMITSYSVIYGEEPEDNPETNGILSMCSFLKSKYVDKDVAELGRPARRALKKANTPPPSPVRFVAMRTQAGTHHGVPTGEHRDWSSRWWVRGHHRAQWMPSKKSHEVRWIAPYLKGPEDKPIKTSVYHVVR